MAESSAEVLIVGGGPTGLYALYLTGLHHLDTILLERLPRLGGQLDHLYPDKPIYDVGGFPMITGHNLVEALKQQALQYPSRVLLNTMAQSLTAEGGLWHIETDHGPVSGRTVIITAGIGEFIPRRFNVDAIDRFEGHGLYYVVNTLEDFRGHDVLVVGGGDSAADWAMAVAQVARQVWMIHRRDTFQCHADSLAKLQALPNVTLLPRHELVAIEGSSDGIDSVSLRDNQTQTLASLALSRVIVAIGLLPGTQIFQRWNLQGNGTEIHVNSAMHTNLPGVFAAGDIVSYPGKVKLISAGFGEAATAVESARHYLRTASTVELTNL
ncbi:MAG: NAD(P)/FAD-dependent oxidoreductase [Sulfobacillus thermosulfidooxidans]|nr:MAG: NAD(P)/FAD-dependent oxidoreductase [Sulfobacillus thermosulfidooxidans]